MAKPLIEKDIEDYFVWCVEHLLHGKTYKFSSPNHSGVADRVACIPAMDGDPFGTTWFVELKRPKKGRISPLQQIFAGEMQALNQRYACLHTKELIDEWAKNICLH